jgi:hypothetical protein
MSTLSQTAWDAMRAMGEFVASRGDAVGEKLTAWTEAKEAFDAKVKEIDAKLAAGRLVAIEVEAALECMEAGHIEGAMHALLNARKTLEGQPS